MQNYLVMHTLNFVSVYVSQYEVIHVYFKGCCKKVLIKMPYKGLIPGVYVNGSNYLYFSFMSIKSI